MSKVTVILVVVVLCVVGSLFAASTIKDLGTWPETWPGEMEPLRKQSRTIVGGLVNRTCYEIPFSNRKEFESVWPHLLKVKSTGAPLILLAAPHTSHGKQFSAMVRIWCPLSHPKEDVLPAVPIPGATSIGGRWLRTTYIELVVDGEIVDLNHIPLPGDTPIIDMRFTESKE